MSVSKREGKEGEEMRKREKNLIPKKEQKCK